MHDSIDGSPRHVLPVGDNMDYIVHGLILFISLQTQMTVIHILVNMKGNVEIISIVIPVFVVLATQAPTAKSVSSIE